LKNLKRMKERKKGCERGGGDEPRNGIRGGKKKKMDETEKVNFADRTWRQEPVPSEEAIRAEQEADEEADRRDADEQEEDFYNDFHQTGGGDEGQ